MVRVLVSAHPRCASGRVLQLRKRYGLPDDFLQRSNFSFKNMKQAGGKGGDPMARTADEKFIVKECSDGDHKSLLVQTPE